MLRLPASQGSDAQTPAAVLQEVVFVFELDSDQPAACFVSEAFPEPEGSTSGVDLIGAEGLGVHSVDALLLGSCLRRGAP